MRHRKHRGQRRRLQRRLVERLKGRWRFRRRHGLHRWVSGDSVRLSRVLFVVEQCVRAAPLGPRPLLRELHCGSRVAQVYYLLTH